ncbi:MAG: amidohydrolase family protein [Phreatobacter sp.]|uniref:amidohydrolase family protein n=1 Tax=Phreatobacter sp. TaxID=1966341 RepID=UPI002736D89A|nr:amidohydrolase family protein [Phreatobacter sp.]MDP2802617.1 amidohydrolase family protein [Phreatobacter sp.]
MTATVPAPPVTAPRLKVPPGACDAHSHVFGPFDTFPPSQASTYPLPAASDNVHAAARATMGISRGVLVQPAPYGMDPAAMLAAVARSDGALRAIAIADEEISDATLADWVARGVRGLRFVEMRAPNGQRYPGSVGFDGLAKLAPRMRALGLHAQLWASAQTYADHLSMLQALRLPLVLDHMASPDIAGGADAPAFRAVLYALREGAVWVKLAVCRVGKAFPAYADARPFHDALIAANPDRLLWGSDWPYVRLEPAPDAGAMLDVFAEWAGDETLVRQILVDNPQHLYQFEPAKRALP